MNSQPEFAFFMGVHWADQKHDAYVIDDHGQGHHESLAQNAASIEDWIEQKLHQANGKSIAILFENSKNGFFHSMLLRDKVVLFPVNPKQFARYRESYQNAGSKNDKSDARLLARMLRERFSTLKPLRLDDEQTRKLNVLCQNRRSLVDQRVKATVRLKSHLKASFPLLLELGLTLQVLIALLKRWPDPRQIRRANKATLSAVLREAGVRNEAKMESLIDKIRTSKLLTRDHTIHDAMAPLFKLECKIIAELSKAIAQFEELIDSEMKTHADAKLFTALPGAGKALAPRLLTAFGSERERFDSADEVAAKSGIAPVTKQSGKSHQVVRRFACSNYLRQTFHEFADCARIWCPWSKAYYQLQRSRGMKHNAAIRKLAHRWIRILFQVWKTRTEYDAGKYIQSISQKNPNIIPFLPDKSLPKTN